MKRVSMLLLCCAAVAGSAWLAHVVWAQAAADTKEKTFTITKSQLDKYVADEIAKAMASDHKDKPVTDEQVLKPDNWHTATFNGAQYVIYTGPGLLQFHHWIPPKQIPGKGGAAATAPKGAGTAAPPAKAD